MKDLRSVRAPLVQAPIAWVARRLLASDESVEAVMVVTYEGKVLAYERAIDSDTSEAVETEDHSLFYYAPNPGLLFYVRLGSRSEGTEIPDRIESILNSPSFSITR